MHRIHLQLITTEYPINGHYVASVASAEPSSYTYDSFGAYNSLASFSASPLYGVLRCLIVVIE